MTLNDLMERVDSDAQEAIHSECYYTEIKTLEMTQAMAEVRELMRREKRLIELLKITRETLWSCADPAFGICREFTDVDDEVVRLVSAMPNV